eukprot:scaffold75_cov376-Prasinococcus_capsulatus_cf.AAC.2
MANRATAGHAAVRALRRSDSVYCWIEAVSQFQNVGPNRGVAHSLCPTPRPNQPAGTAPRLLRGPSGTLNRQGQAVKVGAANTLEMG